jgi:hypothetical protein
MWSCATWFRHAAGPGGDRGTEYAGHVFRRVVSGYITFHNERRLHSAIGHVAPAKYEQNLSRRSGN